VIATFAIEGSYTLPTGVPQIPNNINPKEVLPPISDCVDIKIQEGKKNNFRCTFLTFLGTGLFTHLSAKFRKNMFFAGSTEKIPEMGITIKMLRY
jgi:hypothetical protein